MNRKIIQDLVPKTEPSHRKRVSDMEMEDDTEEYEEPKRRVWILVLFILAVGVLTLGAFLILSSLYSRVSVKVSTTTKNITLDEILSINKDGAGNAIRYDLMNMKESESASVPTTGSKVVQGFAVGTVTIYNSYGKESQRLVAGTRLETKDGKIYKIDKAVTVPGISVSGGKTIPGEVDVTAKASEVGMRYNIPPSEFTIPGFKGNPKYEKFYAKSNKDFTGGWSGELKIASPADIQSARLKLQESLKQKLMKTAIVQTPKGFLLYPDAMFITFSDNTINNSSLIETGEEKTNLQVDATLNAVMIGVDDLKKFLLNKKLSNLDKNQKTVLSDLDKIGFKIINKDRVNLERGDSFVAKIDGAISVMGDFDESDLKNKLSGIKKSKYQEVFKDFPVIEKAEATFSPSWALYFPRDVGRITIDKGF